MNRITYRDCRSRENRRASSWHAGRCIAQRRDVRRGQMKSAVGSLLFLIVVVTIPLCAQEPTMPRATIVAVEGERSWPVPINGQAVGFALMEPEQQVEIAARLGNGGGHAYLDAYLTKRIGPGTT